MTLDEEGKILSSARTAAHNKWMVTNDKIKTAIIMNTNHQELADLFQKLWEIDTYEIKPAMRNYEAYMDRSIAAINQAQRAIRGLS